MVSRDIKILSKFIILEKINIYLTTQRVLPVY